MQLTQTIKLYPTIKQRVLIERAMDEYISTVNDLVWASATGTDISKYTSADVEAVLPAALKNQCVRDAKSVMSTYHKRCMAAVRKNRWLKEHEKEIRELAPSLPVLKRQCCYVNNQNFKITEQGVSFPVMVDGKCTRIAVKTKMTDAQKVLLSSNKLGMMRVVRKNGKLTAQISYEAAEADPADGGLVMGIDLGVKCPAVAYCSDGSVKFYGNGRKNRYMRCHYRYLRKKLQKKKKLKAVKHIHDKEQRIMKDIDHKISRQIVNDAKEKGVTVIKMETLSGIRKSTRTSRKNKQHSIHTWSFYRLASYIEYKAKLAGIDVVYVAPEYTSQACPICGRLSHADDRDYACGCGYHGHRDIVGAMNICASTEAVGKRQLA